MLHFLGIGAQKAGTTWLYQCLKKHPALAFPMGKEVHFWDRWKQGEPTQRYFEAFKDDKRREGEITPAYGILPPSVIAELACHAPSLRLIFLVRNPIDRAWSSALMALGRAEMHYQEASAQWFLDHFASQGSLARGDYAECLQNWWSVYSHDALMVRDYAEVSTSPEQLLSAICEHLGVGPPNADMLTAAKDRVFEGAGHRIPDELRDALVALYEPRIARLEGLLGQSFRHWLTG